MNLRKYLVLAGVTIFAPVGDSFLSYGMKQVGNISLLLGFFASYMTALSWADLTYVLPASSLGYVLLAVIARFALHEQVSLTRWLGIALVSSGVGFVTSGPERTHRPRRPKAGRDGAAAESS